ncbi:hypothetical protein A3A93_05215 [Candidatus Roizmanbacteria bacterium RIFCSPLOWO2_01_FULL_38_12]|uniref:PIN domain-containing protein n=1 Tax=Candidatus Roizmanbacteria bacterium RIFCSPLOWO2_01_FULL_38_12 TaxID=1802061 RepID=A0A1F7IYZ0_9BACT|nr:MAG: hypothetical protein A3F59_01645 [Candidatus Roizmanbacteria bacterium RIFCSPHIGHO2_12_FULL_38_13]OGK48596.1 MAG: hypothetical protein A3A93_05215 [Candidatus Roizmanbacteria bacterium RIFCSPLOWO2_01_FULL_38_12]
MKRYFIDTNIFLRVLIKEDEKSFQECILLLKTIKENKLKAVTSSVVLAEIVWTLLSFYTFPKNRTAEAVESIINLRGLQVLDNYNHRLAIKTFAQSKIKYIDALISSIKEILEKKWIIISYDRDFDKLNVIRKEPHDVYRNI